MLTVIRAAYRFDIYRVDTPMSQNESLNFFLRLVREKHTTLKQQADFLLKEMAGENLDGKKAQASGVRDRAADLRSVLSAKDVPGWLDHAISTLSQFSTGGIPPADFLINMLAWKPELDRQNWSFDSADSTAFDFDAIYERYRSESRLPELFDSVVRILEEIRASGEVDSVAMMNALGKVISTIKKCKDGSYFSLNAAWDFLWVFVKNYLWNELAAVPGLGTAAAALKTAIESINEEMFSLHTKIDGATKITVGAEIKKLDGKFSTPFLTYDRDGYTLPDLNTKLIELKA